jgi:RNA polymerase sigma factor (sigma-70 family)
MTNDAAHNEPGSLELLVAAYRAGDEEAGSRICLALMPDVRRDIARMLGSLDIDVDDVMQDSLVVCLRYIRAERGFEGNPRKLAITIARNRCRDLLRWRSIRVHVDIHSWDHWLADPSRSVLDDLAEHELNELLQAALDNLSEECRRLLHALYVQGYTPEQWRVRSGLSTVQGIYYRRTACLARAKKFLQRHLRFGSRTGQAIDTDRDH